MEKTTTNSAVHVTTNYDKFSMLIANRSTTRNHIANLKQAFQEHPDILEAQPILVNEKMQIIDGQHRFQAASELGLPIYYTQVAGIGIETARTMNVLQKRWDPIDFARSYAMTGNKHYKEYLKAREDFALPHNVTMAALTGASRKGLNSIFKRGEFEVEDLEKGRLYMSRIVEVGDAGSIPMITAYAYALIHVFNSKDFDYDRFLEKLKKHGGTILKRYSQVPDYLRMIEEIYNINNQNRLRLF